MADNTAFAIIVLAIVIIVLGSPFALNEYSKGQERVQLNQASRGSAESQGTAGTCTNCQCPTGQFVTGFDSSGGIMCNVPSLGVGGSTCISGQTPCNLHGTNDCKDLVNDNNNCGACGNVCSPDQTCWLSKCLCINSSTQMCNPPNGPCIDTAIDNNNCGYCGNVCPAGTSCHTGPNGEGVCV